MIMRSKWDICKPCFLWCRNYLVAKHGFYSKKYIHEAFIQFKKPVKCRFFDICGNVIPRVVGKNRLRAYRKAICHRCYTIYKSGWMDKARAIKNRTQGTIKQKDMFDAELAGRQEECCD